MRLNRIILACVFIAGAVALNSCQKNGPAVKRYAFITNCVAEFWTIGESGANDAAEELGVEVSVLMPGTLSDQKQMLEDAVTRGVSGVAVSPMDAENQIEMLNRVAEATTLITHDSDSPGSDRIVYIGIDNYSAGRLCGNLVKEALPEGGEIMILIGRMEQDNSRKRRQGVIDALMDRDEDPNRYDPPGSVIKGERFTILDTLTDGADLAKAKANAEDTLSRYPEIDGMVGLFAYNPPAILQALEQAGKLNQVKVVGFDEDSQTLAGIKEGTIHGTVVQNPYEYGYQSVKIMNAIANGDQSVIPADGVVDIEGRQIRKANIDEFWADLNLKLGKE
ncbi:sugar-binding protein [Verrucomicrobiales bacterium]|jgi:ribose transport system substrate-binding protein|nr:sugar-binding protein [Verrucomicrobiales bacterium]